VILWHPLNFNQLCQWHIFSSYNRQYLWSNIATVWNSSPLVFYRSLLPMDQLQRLKQNLAVCYRVRRGRHRWLELANMLVLVPRLRPAQVKWISQVRQNNVQTVCVAVIGCRKFQSLFENSSLRLLRVKGNKLSL